MAARAAEEGAELVFACGGDGTVMACVTALAGTGDMRQIEAAARAADPDAVLALDVYLHRLAAGIAAMATATGGLDALVFTGGVGENSATVRQRTADRLRFLGVAVDPLRNDTAQDDADITAPDSTVRALVITAREDLQIAAETRQLLQATGNRA